MINLTLKANAASIASSANNRSVSQFQASNQRSIYAANNINEDDDKTSNQSDTQLENSLRIISDFKQKPFDEMKQTLMRTNQTYLNTEKYQQVFEFIQELTSSTNNQLTNSSNLLSCNSTTNTNVTTTQPLPVNGHSLNISINQNLQSTGSVSNLADASFSAVSVTSNISGGVSNTAKESFQKSIPLNDIEFPQLFMY
jgi:hypothetical protein